MFTKRIKVLIIGYGNMLRGDDGAGQTVATRVAALETLPAGVEVLARHQLLPELMELIGRSDRVIFVDAAAGPEPGRVQSAAVTPVDLADPNFTHFFTPENLLTYAGVLYGRCPPATLVTITGRSFGFVERLSPEVETAVDEAVALVVRLATAAAPAEEIAPKSRGERGS